MSLINPRSENKLTIVISHRLSTIASSQDGLVLDRGRRGIGSSRGAVVLREDVEGRRASGSELSLGLIMLSEGEDELEATDDRSGASDSIDG
jgi:hypothetical protein